MDRWKHALACQKEFFKSGDCDPAYPVLKYVAEKEKLSQDAKVWLSFLYSCCYSESTAWAIFKTIGPYSNLNTAGINDWWIKYKPKLLFTTDRLKVKSFNKLPQMCLSFRKIAGAKPFDWLQGLKGSSTEETYDAVWHAMEKIYYVGRFSLFLLTEVIHVLTELPMQPTGLDLKNAESCRNGLCYVIGEDSWVTHKKEQGKLSPDQYSRLEVELIRFLQEAQQEYPELRPNYWNVETFLCAYKKYFWKTRYIGYYIDRQQQGLLKMEANLPELSEDWANFWEARKACFTIAYLGELVSNYYWSGIRKAKMGLLEKFNYLLEK